MTETQIIRDVATYYGESTPLHRWSMMVDDERVSELWVSIETGEIMQVQTDQAHQRNGYASALYRQAATEIEIFHAPPAHRTPEGEAFAASVGGESLPCLHGCAACAADDTEED